MCNTAPEQPDCYSEAAQTCRAECSPCLSGGSTSISGAPCATCEACTAFIPCAEEDDGDDCCSAEILDDQERGFHRCGPLSASGELVDPSAENFNPATVANFQCFACWDETFNGGLGGFNLAMPACVASTDSEGEQCSVAGGFCDALSRSRAAACWDPTRDCDATDGDTDDEVLAAYERCLPLHCGVELLGCVLDTACRTSLESNNGPTVDSTLAACAARPVFASCLTESPESPENTDCIRCEDYISQLSPSMPPSCFKMVRAFARGLRRYYVDAAERLLAGPLQPCRINAKLDRWTAALKPYLDADRAAGWVICALSLSLALAPLPLLTCPSTAAAAAAVNIIEKT